MPGRMFDGDYGFPLGVNSGTYPDRLGTGQYFRSWNSVNRGGLLKCRPGFKTLLSLPSGLLQGFWEYRPLYSEPILIAAVSGKIYFSPMPFNSYTELPNIQFDPYAPYVYLESCSQVVKRNLDGSRTLINPRSILVMQDGLSKPAYFDGAISGHIEDTDFKLPQGTVMKWSGNRLWVARRNALFASDIGNPFSFQEGQYVGTINAFVMPGRVSAMAETPSLKSPSLVVFTDDTTTLIQSNLQQRALWPTTTDFIKTVFRNLGCPGHLSPVSHHGVLWWMSKLGMQRLDVAISGEQSTAMPIIDSEMSANKGRLSPNLQSCAGASFENYMLQSVPYASYENTETWVHDSTPTNASWNGHWTGVRPVGWITGLYAGQPRCFFASRDYDGVNRIWEAFRPEHLDNGCRIKWGFESRGYNAGNVFDKKIRYFDIAFSELQGDVDIKVAWANSKRGSYSPIGEQRFKALQGTLKAGLDMSAGQDDFGLKPQSRVFRTQDVSNTPINSRTSCGVESAKEDWLGSAFQVCVKVEGPGAVEYVRAHIEGENEDLDGRCAEDETNIRAVRYDGVSFADNTEAQVLDALRVQAASYTSIKTVSVTEQGITETATATGFSSVSQEAADYAAECTARLKAQSALDPQLRSHLGGFAGGFPQ